METPDFSGKTVLIIAGEFAGVEGVCLGEAPGAPGLWAVSPDSSDRIVNLRFEVDFGVLINPGQKPGAN